MSTPAIPKLALTAIVGFVLVAGCDRNVPASHESGAPANTSAAPIDQKIADLKVELASVKERLTDLEIKRSLDDKHEGAFDPAEQTFQQVETEDGLGRFAVSLQGVQPIADSLRVTLNIGNLTMGTFNGAKLTITYGARRPVWAANTDFAGRLKAWEETKQSKEISLTTALKPGSWNPTTVTLPNIQASKFGWLSLKISADQISLAVR